MHRLFDGPVERRRHRAQFAEIADAAANRARFDSEADRGGEGVVALEDDLDVVAGSGQALDADRLTRAEGGGDAVVAQQCLLDDLFLHFAVEPDREFSLVVALAQRDERVLLRQLFQRLAQPGDLPRFDRANDTLQGRRREGARDLPLARVLLADAVADPRRAQPVQSDDLARARRVRLDGGSRE